MLIFLAAWRRHEITEICFMGIQRLRKSFPIKTLCVISEESMKPLCKKYNIDYVFYKNDPLGEKKNFGLTESLKQSWDYLIEIGSDDILKVDLLEAYLKEERELMSLGNFCYLNSETLECRNMVSSTSYGIGRAIRRDVIEKYCKGVVIKALDDLMSPGRTTVRGDFGFFPLTSAKQMVNASQAEIVGEECYKLWSDRLNKGLDNNSNFFLHINGVMEKQMRFSEPMAIDIKSKENIWPFTDCGKPFELEKCLSGLSSEEKTAILSLKK